MATNKNQNPFQNIVDEVVAIKFFAFNGDEKVALFNFSAVSCDVGDFCINYF